MSEDIVSIVISDEQLALEREYMRLHTLLVNSMNPSKELLDEFKIAENDLKEYNAKNKQGE